MKLKIDEEERLKNEKSYGEKNIENVHQILRKNHLAILGQHYFINPPIECFYQSVKAFPQWGIERFQVGYCVGITEVNSLDVLFEKDGAIF